MLGFSNIGLFLMCVYSMPGELQDVIDGLDQIGIDETVHDLPDMSDQDEPTDDKQPDQGTPTVEGPHYPEALRVKCAADIVGARAAIVYADCLKQLALQVHLPVTKCLYMLHSGEVCSSVAPFDVVTSSMGTAVILNWVS